MAAYPTEKTMVEDPSGHGKVYTIKDTESGKPKYKHFCGNCGCTFWTVPMVYGGDLRMVRTSLIKNG